MIFVVLGSLVMWVGVWSFGLFWGRHDASRTGDPISDPTWALIVFPPLATWFTVELINLLSPRRLFDRRSVAPVRQATLGLTGAVVGFIIAVAFLPIVENVIKHDWMTLVAAPAIGTMIPTVLLPRIRKGHCVFCDYDLRTLPSMEQCPECGKTGVL